jgi:hypothetical protein
MSINTLSLPTDIPWTRRCVTYDMEEGAVCDQRHPPKWRSSMAIFTYEPPATEQTLADKIVSYVKVSCTITGHQSNSRNELKLPRTVTGFQSANVTEQFENDLGKYNACYGALLLVAVGRRSFFIDQGASDRAYIADFEPKKRELYELVTATGERMSRTLEGINVRKSNTTSESNEVVDSFGVSLEASESAGVKEAQQPETKRGVQVSTGNDKTHINQRQVEDTRTTDQSREARETWSHTTQLTQMYHQFLGYHVGTNRAMFLMLPRPHVVQSPQTFVKGPRQLEGIQEVFLVVVRPKDWEDFCIEATLETAHLSQPETEPVTETVVWMTKKHTAGPMDVDQSDSDFKENDRMGPEVAEFDQFVAPPGTTIVDWRLKSESQFNGRWELISDTSTSLVVKLIARAYFDDRLGAWPNEPDNVVTPGHIQLVFEMDLLTTKQTLKAGDTTRLYMTGRSLCCCEREPSLAIGDYITFENTLSVPPHPNRLPEGFRKLPQLAGMSILEANMLRDRIGEQLVASVNSSRRLPAGLIGFTESEYVASRVAATMGKADNILAAELAGLSPEVLTKLRAFEGVRRRDLLTMGPQEQQERFNLTDEELLNLRRAVIGLVATDAPSSSYWDRKRFGGSQIPDVVHLDLAAAKDRLRRARLEIGEISYVDHPACRGKVLKQKPEPGPRRLGQGPVELEVSSGSCVLVPQLDGLSLSDALAHLRAAGLLSEPTFTRASASAGMRVRGSRPAAGSWITPHAEIVLILTE